MISLVRGPGGPLRRLAAELVPFGVALLAIGLYMPLAWTLPTWFAALAGGATAALTWAAVSLLLRAVRARPLLRRLYRVALLLHVLYWSALGVAATDTRAAGPLVDGGRSAWREAVSLHAGVAHTDFTLPAWTTLAGWGQRPRRITMPPFGGLGPLGRMGQEVMGSRSTDGGRVAPLFRTPDASVPSQGLGVTALVLRPGDPSAGSPVAIVRVDLVTADRRLTRAVLDGVSDLGFRPEGLVLAATHTHSGPGGYSDVPMSAVIGTDHFDPDVFEAVRRSCISAMRTAHAAAEPARLALLTARDRDAAGSPVLDRNRRKADQDDIDDRVYGLRIAARADDRTLAAVLNYPTHPVLLRRRHMGFHRDLAGALESAIQQRLPGSPLVVYLNGAQGDISARAVPGARGAERARILAARFADEVFLPAWKRSAGALRTHVRIAAARTRRRLATPRLVKAFGEREALLEVVGEPLWSGDVGALAANALTLPVNVFFWSLALPEVRFGFSWQGAVGFGANLEQGVGDTPYDFGAWVFETGAGVGAPAERFALLWQPAEATQAAGKAWRDAATKRGFEHTLLVGLAGGSAAYITTETEYCSGGYEAVGSLYGSQAAAQAGEALLDALARAGKAP